MVCTGPEDEGLFKPRFFKCLVFQRRTAHPLHLQHMVLSHTPRQVTQHVAQWLTHPVMLGISYLGLETILDFVEKMQHGMVHKKLVKVNAVSQ